LALKNVPKRLENEIKIQKSSPHQKRKSFLV
jgi:hypothetical protein